jgi:hypothetical protein
MSYSTEKTVRYLISPDCESTCNSVNYTNVRTVESHSGGKLALSALCASLYTVSWLAVFSILILSAAIFTEAKLTSINQPDEQGGNKDLYDGCNSKPGKNPPQVNFKGI